MDSKITKSRLSNFLSYEWILMIVVAVLAVFGWELIYTTAAVRISDGQKFVYYYDKSVTGLNPNTFDQLLDDNDTFSYDILYKAYEQMSDETASGGYDVLTLRLSLPEGDAIFCDTNQDEKTKTSRANTLIDTYSIYDVKSLLKNAKKYLSALLKDEFVTGSAEEIAETDVMLDYANLDENKISDLFYTRLKGDNRLREGSVSPENEKARIKKLCEETAFFQKVLMFDETVTSEESIFYSYRKYEQAYTVYENKEDYKEAYENSAVKKYGLKIDALKNLYGKDGETEAKNNAENFFSIKSERSLKGVIALVFNFSDGNDGIYDLQFESISFLNTIIRSFSVLESKVA